MNFSRFPNFDLTSFFHDFRKVRKVWNFQSSETSKILQIFLQNYSNFLASENAKTFQFLPFFGLIWTKNDKNWPFLVWFGLNLGLNNLKFVQEDIFYWILLKYRIDSIKSTAKMAFWTNFKLFRPKLSPFWTKNGRFHCFI